MGRRLHAGSEGRRPRRPGPGRVPEGQGAGAGAARLRPLGVADGGRADPVRPDPGAVDFLPRGRRPDRRAARPRWAGGPASGTRPHHRPVLHDLRRAGRHHGRTGGARAEACRRAARRHGEHRSRGPAHGARRRRPRCADRLRPRAADLPHPAVGRRAPRARGRGPRRRRPHPPGGPALPGRARPHGRCARPRDGPGRRDRARTARRRRHPEHDERRARQRLRRGREVCRAGVGAGRRRRGSRGGGVAQRADGRDRGGPDGREHPRDRPERERRPPGSPARRWRSRTGPTR